MTENDKPRAFSYIRWSSEKQTAGDSLRRQTEAARKWAVAHDLELDETTSYLDAGVSAALGRNAKKGALHSFLRAVEYEVIPQGSYLLVESLDRLSRQSPWDALPLFQQIINEGVNIVTLQDGRIWNRDQVRENPFRIMESLMVMIRAHEESATKSKRVRAARERNRQDAASGKITTAKVPAWLSVNADKTGFVVIEERAAIVRRIYEMYDQGSGQTIIARALNNDDIPSFGNNLTEGTSAKWNKTYIGKLVRSKAPSGVLEQFVHRELGSDGPLRTKTGEVPDYYPVIIDQGLAERVWLRAQSVQPKGRHATKETKNILAGVGRCPDCGGAMTRVTNSTRKGGDRLACLRGRAGACSGRSVAMRFVTDAIEVNLAQLLDPKERTGGGASAIPGWEAKLSEAEDAVQALAVQIAREPTLITTLRSAMQIAEEELAEAREGYRKAMDEAVVASGLAWDVEARRLREAVASKDAAAANQALRRLAESVVVDITEKELTFHWRSGGISSVYWGPDFDVYPGGYVHVAGGSTE